MAKVSASEKPEGTRRRGQSAAATEAASAAKSSSLPPPPPPFKDVRGKAVIKDFRCETTREIRPFTGTVVAYVAEFDSYKVRYSDGDGEDLVWQDLHPLLQRAAAAAAATAAAGTSGGGRASSKAAVGKPSKRQGLPVNPPTSASKTAGKAAGKAASKAAGKAASKAAGVAAISGSSIAGVQVPPTKHKQQERTAPAAAKHQQKPAGRQSGSSKAEAAPVAEASGVAQVEAQAITGQLSTKKRKGSTKELQQSDEDAPPAKLQRTKGGKGAAAAGGADGAQALVQAQKAGKNKAATIQQRATKQQQQQEAEEEGDEGAGGSAAGGGGRRRQEPSGPEIGVPLPQLWKAGKKGQPAENEYRYTRGEEPWRGLEGFNWAVHDELDLDAHATERIRKVQRTYNRMFIRIEAEERQRVAEHKEKPLPAVADGGKVKRASARPDRKAESEMIQQGQAIRGEKVAGHYPGWNIGSRSYGRSELSITGFHRQPVAGIDCVGVGAAGKGAPSFAVSVMVSGWYQDDNDGGRELWYTGEGGNDLLHGRNQVADQALKRGNAALVGNIQLGIPVRVTRKQKDPHGHYGCTYIYDGLYDVVAYRHVKGQEGKYVYKFKLVRREGQGKLLSECVDWGGIAAARAVVPKTRQGVVDLDISRGLEERPIAAIDATWLERGHHGDDHEPQGDLPPCTRLEDVVDEKELVGKVVRGINKERIEQLRGEGYRCKVQYITKYEFHGQAPHPRPAVLPEQYSGNPHAYIKELNHGKLPYNDRGQLFNPQPVLYECGPWAGCSRGCGCPQAVTQQAKKFRLEVFKTASGCGWGLRSLDMIPQFAYICTYVGQVYQADEYEHLVRTVEEQDAEYAYDMGIRPETDWNGMYVETPEHLRAEYVVCGLRKRNVGAFLNHSCAPTCFVQPVLDAHHDTRMPKICIFASENLPPLTELTLDYGDSYASAFPGGCKCGAADCISKRVRPAAKAGAAGVEAAAEAAAGEGAAGAGA